VKQRLPYGWSCTRRTVEKSQEDPLHERIRPRHLWHYLLSWRVGCLNDALHVDPCSVALNISMCTSWGLLQGELQLHRRCSQRKSIHFALIADTVAAHAKLQWLGSTWRSLQREWSSRVSRAWGRKPRKHPIRKFWPCRWVGKFAGGQIKAEYPHFWYIRKWGSNML